MGTLRQISGSLLLAIFSIALVLGVISLALAERTPSANSIPPNTLLFPTLIDTPTSLFLDFGTLTPLASGTIDLLTTTGTDQGSSIATNTFLRCGRPGGWVFYIVKAGDTLFSLAQGFGISIAQLQNANCIPSNQTNLNTGQSLWVPIVAITLTPLTTGTPTYTPISIIFPTLTQTATMTGTPTNTGTATPTASFTATPSPTETATANP